MQHAWSSGVVSELQSLGCDRLNEILALTAPCCLGIVAIEVASARHRAAAWASKRYLEERLCRRRECGSVR